MADDLLNNVLGADYQEVNAVQSGNAVYKNGKLQYFKIDIDQPGKYFFDLTDAFNATVDESNKIIPLQFVRGGQPLQLNGFTISMDGKYPDMTTGFHVAGKLNTSSPAFVNFALPLGMFQAVGPYRFQFTITNSSTRETLKSPYQFFNVTESATNLAIDINKGIEPFDSEYQAWKNQVEAQINQNMTELNNIADSANQIKGLMNSYVQTANDRVDAAWQDKLNGNNTWTGNNTFSGSSDLHNLTVNGWVDAKEDLTVEQDLHVKGQADLPDNTTIGGQSVAFQLKGQATLEGLSSNDEGTFINYYVNNNFLYITGWIGNPKTVFKTFKAYLPTSITSRVVGGNSSYYVGVNDYDWYTDTSTTQPTEFCLVPNTGLITINGAANNGGARLNWALPLNQQ